MTKDEALKLALEALEHEAQRGNDNAYQSERKAIKEALAQPKERYTYGTPLLDAFTKPAPVQEPVQVSPLEFVTMVMEKEHLVGKPLFWAEWPNKE